MQPFTRYLGLALIPLLAFLAVAVAGQAWLQKETRRLQADAIAVRRAQLVQALAITHRAPGTWDDAFERELGLLLGGAVTLEAATPKPVPGEKPAPGLFSFDHPFPDAPGLRARVTFAAPVTTRLIILQQRMLAAVVLLALVLIVVFVLLSLYHRPAGGADSRAPWPGVRSEMLGVEHFARISVERSKALEQETGARHRAEEDLQVSRTLLDHSMQARVQLGRDLHDNICQTLYAVSLSLEAVRRTISGEGAAITAGPRLDQCISEMRRLNHEVRSYLKDLGPDAVRRMPFAEAIGIMLGAQSGAGRPELVRDVDPEAASLIAPEQTAEVVSILREAVSNSVRHGCAKAITLQARRGEESVVLAVQDDGQGFDPAAAGSQGHGLANMKARAAAMGGSLKITSTPGKGTRILLTVPVVLPG
jgi:signal transduction histidine kinase